MIAKKPNSIKINREGAARSGLTAEKHDQMENIHLLLHV